VSGPSLVIKHTGAAAEVFAPTLEVLRQEVADKSAALVASSGFEITDPSSFARANDLATVMHATKKEIEAREEYLKSPLLDTQRACKSIIAATLDPLVLAHRSLVGRIAAYDKKQKDAALAAQREAERKAEEERAAKQRIADEEHAAKVKAARDEAERQAKELAEVLGTPVEAKPVAITPSPVVAPVKPAPVVAPVAPSAVTTRLVPKLIITDPRKVAAAYQVGMEILVRLDEAAIKRAIDAGAIVDGAHIEMIEQTAMKAVRP
jgi:hypothetical protein